jgi:hypothetical protein
MTTRQMNSNRPPLKSQADWRATHQIRWIEVFDEIEGDLSSILKGLKKFVDEAELCGSSPPEIETSALHLEALVSEVREKLPS